MVLQLTFNDFLRLRRARGAAIEVLDGAVWITEDDGEGDKFLGPGRSYRVRGGGLVVVGAEGRQPFARVEVRGPASGFLSRLLASWRAARTRHALSELSDCALKDIGLRRDQIERLYGDQSFFRR
jgi:uncharacterized protein YjiS (DUF1127 family)